MNVESIAEVKVLTSNYQAEYGRSSGLQITAVTKSGTNRFRGSVYDVERNSDWNANSKTNILNGDPKTTSEASATGATRSAARSASRAGSNKLFFFYARNSQPRTAGNDVARFRVPTALERQGDFSQTLDNNGAAVPVHQGSAARRRHVHGDATSAAASGRRRARQDSGEPAVSDRAEHPEHVSAAERARPPGWPTTTSSRGRPRSAQAWQPAIRVDYQPSQSLRVTFKYSGWEQPKARHQRHRCRASTTRRCSTRSCRRWRCIGQLHAEPVDVPRSDVRPQPERAGGLRVWHGGTGPTFCTRGVPDEPGREPANTAGSVRLPLLFPDALKLDPELLRVRGAAATMAAAVWRRPRGSAAAELHLGQPRRQRAAEHGRFPGSSNINATDDSRSA